MATKTIHRIIQQIESLDESSRLQILEKLVILIRKSEGRSESSKITYLQGLGAEIWKNVDIDKYIENERAWN